MSKSTITVSITDADAATIERLVQEVPLANRHAIASAALRAGLDLFEERPDSLMAILTGHRVRIRPGGSP